MQTENSCNILDECMLFVKYCFIQQRCEYSKCMESKIHLTIRFPFTNQSPLIISIKIRKNRSNQKGTTSSSHTKTTHPQYTYIALLFIFSFPLITMIPQRPTSSLEFWILDFPHFCLLKDTLLIVHPICHISNFSLSTRSWHTSVF